MTYAELAQERDDLKSENEALRAIMDKMLAKGNALKEENERMKDENKKLLDSVENLSVGKCVLHCPLAEQRAKETAREKYDKILEYFPIDKDFITLSRKMLDEVFSVEAK